MMGIHPSKIIILLRWVVEDEDKKKSLNVAAEQE
jgi:hypothetical protein